MLNFYKEVIAFRKAHGEAFVKGVYAPVPVDDRVVAYERRSSDGKRFTVLVNLSADAVEVSANYGECVLNTHEHFGDMLQPFQAVVLAK